MKNKIKLGIIGKNFGYNVIYKSFIKNNDYKIVGFSFKSKKFDKIKLPKKIKVYFNWKKLILNKNINAIAIAAPPTLHKNIIEFGIKHNKHIFCEKPFTCSKKEANYVCQLIDKKKNISHMVNYEFIEISAFRFFKRQILDKKIKINKIDINWFMNLKKSGSTWKNNHNDGGGIMFNYVCHAIYYLEFLFGKITSTKSNIFSNTKENINSLNSIVFFKSGLSAKLKVKVCLKNFTVKPMHQIKIISDKNVYLLRSDINSLFDQFEVIKIYKSSKKYLFKNKNNTTDFRIKPTFINSKKFSSWILKGKKQKPNFFDAQRIHLIIDQMLRSSNQGKEIYIE